uniref:Uncharacterized protein n=1 Tax=Anguilla anguilla TaxID=7936 RepID=A0A0E9Q6L9_ANGAN
MRLPFAEPLYLIRVQISVKHTDIFGKISIPIKFYPFIVIVPVQHN